MIFIYYAKVHYKTFDGKVYSFQSDCSHVLVRDAVASTFSIVYGNGRKKSITVFVEDFTYEIDTDGKCINVSVSLVSL